jgi:hypothetical protein
VVVCDVAAEGDFDLLGRAAAVELSAGLVGVTLGDAVVDEGVETMLTVCFEKYLGIEYV